MRPILTPEGRKDYSKALVKPEQGLGSHIASQTNREA